MRLSNLLVENSRLLEKQNIDVASNQLTNGLLFIFLINIFVMIRGYVLSNLLETILFIFLFAILDCDGIY